MTDKSDPPKTEPVSRQGVIAMSAIILALAIVTIYANWQNWHRDRVESATITRFAPSPSASPSTSPR